MLGLKVQWPLGVLVLGLASTIIAAQELQSTPLGQISGYKFHMATAQDQPKHPWLNPGPLGRLIERNHAQKKKQGEQQRIQLEQPIKVIPVWIEPLPADMAPHGGGLEAEINVNDKVVAVQLAVQAEVQQRRPRPPMEPEPATSSSQPTLSDDQLLAKVRLDPKDGKALLEFIRHRTLKEDELEQLQKIIKRFGADAFEERIKAVRQVERFGAAALGPLKAAIKDSDPEVSYRAQQALQRLETIPQTQVMAAVIRALVQQKPPGTTAALLAYVPLAAEEEILLTALREALTTLAVGPDGKADPALLAALEDRHPLRRKLAMLALIEGGPADRTIRVPDAYPRVRQAARQETHLETRFAVLWTLLLITRQNEFLPDLLALIPSLPRGHLWQLEDLLLQLTDHQPPPGGRFLKDPASLAKARDAWLQWWKEKGQHLDLATFRYQPRIQGITAIVEVDVRGYAQGRAFVLGPDMRESRSVTGLNYPCDMKLLPNGHILVAEMNTSRVVEFDANGTQVRAQFINQQPFALEILENGDIQVICRNNVYLFDKQWKQKQLYSRPNYDIVAGCRLPSGETLLIRNVAQGSTGFRIDAQFKELRDTHSFARMNHLQNVEPIDNERILVCEYNRVAEYNLKTGKLLWHYNCNNPNSAQRLPNGNTLITLMNDQPNGRVIELDPSGEIVWEYQPKDPGLRPIRAWRR